MGVTTHHFHDTAFCRASKATGWVYTTLQAMGQQVSCVFI